MADVREKLVEQLRWWSNECDRTNPGCQASELLVAAANYIANCVTVQEWYSVNDYPKEDGTYLVKTNTGAITTARFYAFKSFPATKHLPAYHRSASWQSNRNVVKWTFLPYPPKGE